MGCFCFGILPTRHCHHASQSNLALSSGLEMPSLSKRIREEMEDGADAGEQQDRPAKRRKLGKPREFLIAANAGPGHRMAIRRQIQKKKKIRKREIPSAWAKVHEAALHKVTQDVWEAIKSESKVPTEAVHKMETIRAGLDHSKPADLPKSIQEPLQELLQGIGHDIWVQNPELMSPEKATSFGLLYTTVFRCPPHCSIPGSVREMQIPKCTCIAGAIHGVTGLGLVYCQKPISDLHDLADCGPLLGVSYQMPMTDTSGVIHPGG